MSSMFDFSKTESASSGGYLKPGMYKVSVSGTKFTQPEDTSKNSFIEVTFAAKNGDVVKEKFFITPKAIARLQYLHEAWFGKKLTKIFSTPAEVGAYFEKWLMEKKLERGLIVGGTQTDDGRIFGNLPYSGFVISENQDFEEGAIDETNPRWKELVRKSTPSNRSMTSESALLSDSSDGLATSGSDDVPWM